MAGRVTCSSNPTACHHLPHTVVIVSAVVYAGSDDPQVETCDTDYCHLPKTGEGRRRRGHCGHRLFSFMKPKILRFVVVVAVINGKLLSQLYWCRQSGIHSGFEPCPGRFILNSICFHYNHNLTTPEPLTATVEFLPQLVSAI